MGVHESDPPRGPVVVHLVGPLGVRRAGRELTAAEVGSRKGRTLLRLLCARRGEVLGCAEISAVLWPEGAPADPEAVLASLASRLRRVLGGDAVLGGREGYRIGAVETDLDEARRLIDAAERSAPTLAAVSAGAALRLLEAGPVLPEEPGAEWAEPVRAQAAVLCRRARHLAARAALESGDATAAEEAARRAVEEDPVDEAAVRLLLRAQLAGGVPAEALRTYERLRRALAEELGADPAAETRELHAAALRGEVPTPAVHRTAPPADRLGLAGRADELAVLTAAWEAACRRKGSLVLLAGEPGIGKTRLLEELSAVARRSGGTVLAGRSFAGERSLFAQPVVDALATAPATLPAARLRAAASGLAVLGRLVPELADFTGLPPADPAGTDASQGFVPLAAFLRGLAAEGPVLLAVDDLQRAGRSTLELLHYLGRRLAGAPVLLVATVRSGEEGAEVAEVLGAVATPLSLGPLPATAVSELAGRAGHEARAAEVMRRTGGHPLFVVEVLRALSQGDPGLPASVQAAVVERVARTGAETERLLRAAAVLGSAFDPRVAAALIGTPETGALPGFERALGARLLVETGAQYEFAHDVVREALLATTPSPTRLALHARAADLLSAQPEALAAHAEAIGDRPRAARARLLAAERALARFAATDAIALATRAAALAAEVGDDELRGRALVARGRAHDATAHFAAAYADLVGARDAARAAGDARLRMTVLRELAGDVPVALGHPPADCEPVLRECLGLAESLGDRGMQADVLSRLAVLRCSQLDFTDARRLARRGLAAGLAAEDPGAHARGLDAVKTATAYLGIVGELEPVVAELEPLLRRLGDLWRLQWTVFESAFVPLAAGDDDGALARIDAAREVCRRSGYIAHEPFFIAHAGWVHRLSGRPDDALREGHRAVELAARHRHTWWSTTAASLYAGTLLATGDPAGAAAVLRPARAVADVPGAQGYLLRILGPLAEATGDPVILEEADRLLRSIQAPEGCAWLLGADAYLAVAAAWRRADRPERADEILAGFRAAAATAGWNALVAVAR